MPRLLALAAALVLFAPPSALAGSHPFSVHDMLAMERISSAVVSPTGTEIAFVLRTTDLDANRGRTDIWSVGVDGSGLRQLTTDPASDWNPVWSPGGESIFFVSNRSGSSQAWRLPVDGGEAVSVTDHPVDVDNLILSRDGAKIAFSAQVYVDCADLACTADRLVEEADRPSSGLLYDSLFVRHWDTWRDGRRNHLFVQALKDGAATGAPVDVTAGLEVDVPSLTWGGPEEYTFSPDSSEVIFTAKMVGKSEAWSTDFDLYRAATDGSSGPVDLTEKNAAWDTQPVFSPDGRTLAWLAMARPGFESDRFRIKTMAWPDGEVRTLTESWDRSARGIEFAADGRTIYTTADQLGQRPLFAVDVKTGEVATLVAEGTIRGPQVAGEEIVFGRDDLRSPVELYRVSPDGGRVSGITAVNEARVSAARMGTTEQFSFAGWNDERVHAYVVRPADFDPKKKWPVAFLIHGGPQGSFGNDFHYRWNPQAYAGAGYAAVMVDFHGSIGYGQDFTDSISGDWGGKPFEDLQKGLAAAIERYPWLDGDRVCALGASYGGYMINWIAGNWPDRFDCLVNHDGNIDERMAYYDTEELWFPEWERGGPPWKNPEAYSRHNPIDHVGKWKTPMLVIHGALDYRVVDTQGISTFTALQRRGIESRLLYFPDEDHWVQKPHNSIQWHETVLEWLDRHLGPMPQGADHP